MPSYHFCIAIEGVLLFGDRMNASGRSKAAVTARTRIGWIKFIENVESYFMGESFR